MECIGLWGKPTNCSLPASRAVSGVTGVAAFKDWGMSERSLFGERECNGQTGQAKNAKGREERKVKQGIGVSQMPALGVLRALYITF